jgi:hypothetical protein
VRPECWSIKRTRLEQANAISPLRTRDLRENWAAVKRADSAWRGEVVRRRVILLFYTGTETESHADMEFENVLSKIAGEHVSAARQTLPPAESDTSGERITEIMVPDLGLVRFYFRRLTSKKGKSRHTFWCAERAVVLRAAADRIASGPTLGGDGKPIIDC